MRRSIAFTLAALIWLSACDGRRAPEPIEEPSPTAGLATVADSALARLAECENPLGGYSVGYPDGWHVHGGEVVEPCSLFHPEPFEVPAFSELPMEIAIAIGVQPVPFETVLEADRGRRDISRDSTSIDGRAAARIESETTGEGLYDAGIRTYP